MPDEGTNEFAGLHIDPRQRLDHPHIDQPLARRPWKMSGPGA
jgi:hypothetical protein